MAATNKLEIVAGLQNEILRMQGFKPATSSPLNLGLGPIAHAFPNQVFPTGCIHELICEKLEHSASTIAFTAGLVGKLMGNNGTALWISASRKLFPPALNNYGIIPDHVIFIDLNKEKDVLWAMDEALKCSAITSVIGELKEISFNESRKLQLAVEHSKATGFIIRNNYKHIGTTACVSRWKITHLPAAEIENLPGIGFPKWKVELLRIRNGNPGVWEVQWRNRSFHDIQKLGAQELSNEKIYNEQRKAG